MASTTSATLLRAAARPALRQSVFAAGAAPSRHAASLSTRTALPRFRFRDGARGRRWQSTTAGPQPSWFQRMWDSPVGLKTVHFWAPIMKWAIVIAGIADFARPAEKLSLTQNLALTGTGLIWTRWCLIIKPKNYLLAAVNFFLGIVGIVQVSRILVWQQSQKDIATTVKDAEVDIKQGAQEIKEAVKDKVQA